MARPWKSASTSCDGLVRCSLGRRAAGGTLNYLRPVPPLGAEGVVREREAVRRLLHLPHELVVPQFEEAHASDVSGFLTVEAGGRSAICMPTSHSPPEVDSLF